MLASQSHWSQIPSSDHFGDLREAGYEDSSLIGDSGHDYYYSQSSSSHNTSKSRSSKTMPSKSRRSSTVDGDYEWDEPEQDHKKKSRSKLPAEDKLIKRRDQNRVSQRAFRQRKEKHTKELEAKVEELENLLETASHENSIVTSQMSRMEEELCYYRRLLFAGANGQGLGISPPPSEASTSVNSSYSANYTSASSYPATYSPIPATSGLATGSYVNSPRSNGSSSTNSSPALTNIPGDFSSSANGVESFWGYDVPQTPGYMQFNTTGTAQTHSWQGADEGW